jgi:hypothetical protein
MNATLIEQIETNVERGSSALFAGAIGFAVYGGFGEVPLQPELGLGMGVAAVIAFVLSRSALQAVAEREQRFAVRAFDVREIELIDDALLLTHTDRIGTSELVLTDDDRLQADELLLTDRVEAHEEPLELNDILDELRPDARVVRLFDRRQMPTPGQLKSRIDNHLEQAPPRPLSDASQALSDALAELRRSLR